jgi:hypothetical protein
METHNKTYCTLSFVNKLLFSLPTSSIHNNDVRIRGYYSHSLGPRNRCVGRADVIPQFASVIIQTTLFYHLDFVKEHPEYVSKDNALGFMSSDNGTSYNLCHCQSFFFLFIISGF